MENTSQATIEELKTEISNLNKELKFRVTDLQHIEEEHQAGSFFLK